MTAPAISIKYHLRWILPLILIAVTASSLVFLKRSQPEAKPRPITEQEWAVSTITAKPGAYQPEITLFGQVESPQLSQLSSAVTAYVTHIHVTDGEAVKRNQLLIELDERDARLTLQQRQADLASSKALLRAEHVRHQSDLSALKLEKDQLSISQRSLDRYQGLAAKKVVSDERVEAEKSALNQQLLTLNNREQSIADHGNRVLQLEAAVARHQALVENAQLDLERTKILAPFDGRVVSVNAALGNRIKVGETLLEVFDPKQLEIRAQVPANRIAALKHSLAHQVALNASAFIDGQSTPVNFSHLAATIKTGQGGLDAFFSTDEVQLEPGRKISLTLSLPTLEQVFAVPAQALYGTDRVYKVVDKRLVAAQVDVQGYIKTKDGQRVLIASDDLVANDQVITTQLPNAISGLKVKSAKP